TRRETPGGETKTPVGKKDEAEDANSEGEDEAAGGVEPDGDKGDDDDPSSDGDGDIKSSPDAAGATMSRTDEAELMRSLRGSLVGATVRVDSGRHAGRSGQIVRVGRGGHLEVEGVGCMVRSGQVSLVDDGGTRRTGAG
ncbi:hypothetical protein THAOC_37907, partial [Thalassiosira oceanica]